MYPPTDKTWFDDWLKQPLYRDITFRVVVVALIAGIATWYVVAKRGLPIAAYFRQFTDTVAPLVNTVGSMGVALCVVALMFKDLEAIRPDKFGQTTSVGKVAGVVRRMAGDLSLWTLGALVTLLVCGGVAALAVANTPANAGEALLSYGLTALLAFGTAVLNFFVRRGQPSPWHSSPGSALGLVLSYGAVLFAQALATFV